MGFLRMITSEVNLEMNDFLQNVYLSATVTSYGHSPVRWVAGPRGTIRLRADDIKSKG